MSRFRWVIARTLGRDGLREDGMGGFRVLYDSYTFRNNMRRRRIGRKSAIVQVWTVRIGS